MSTQNLNRRRFITSALSATALVVANKSFGSLVHANPLSSRTLAEETRRFAAVKVARDRVIRTVVGLRPYRAEGFVVEAEQLANKLLVHNYGHGGAGITLSWGTSSLAVDLARDFAHSPDTRSSRGSRTAPRRFAVLGCGVMGLSTARLLQQRLQGEGGTVTIYAKTTPPETTSNIAGGLWYPSSIYDPESTTSRFMEQFRSACLLSNRAFQELVGTEYGVRWTDTYELITREGSLNEEIAGGAALYPQTKIHRNPSAYFGFPYARQFNTMMIEPHTYLRALLRDFYTAGGKVVVKEFKDRREIARLPEQVVFNCTGLGSRELLGDEKLGPVRGQLEILLPQPEVDYCYLSNSGYMFPRRDGIVLGGTFDHDDWSLDPKPSQTTRILQDHAEIMRRLST